MNLFLSALRRPSLARAAVRWVLGLALLLGTVPGLRLHAERLTDMQERGLPLAASLIPLDRKLQLLTAETELAGTQKELRSGSRKEQLHMFVLPQQVDRTRVIGFLDALQASIVRRNTGRGTLSVDLGTAGTADAKTGLAAVPVSFTVQVQPDTTADVLNMLQLSGLLTVADALPLSGVQDLLKTLEHTRPTDIASLEQFLALDLHAYAQQPELYEQRLLGAIDSEGFRDAFRIASHASLLPAAVTLLQGEQGRSMVEQGIWPGPFLHAKSVFLGPVTDGFQEVRVGGETYVRK